MDCDCMVERLNRLNRLRECNHGWLVDSNEYEKYIYNNHFGKYVEVNLITKTSSKPFTRGSIKYQGILKEKLGRYKK